MANQIKLYAGPGVKRLKKQLQKRKAIPIYSDSEECPDNSITGQTTARKCQQPSKNFFVLKLFAHLKINIC